MHSNNKHLIRNVTVPLIKQRKRLNIAQCVNDAKPVAHCEAFDSLTSPKPQTTLKILKKIENLKLHDLDLDSDDDDLRRCPPSFDVNERLYNNLLRLDVDIPCRSKSLPRPQRKPLDKDPVPDECDFLIPSSFLVHSFKTLIAPEMPSNENVTDGHSLFKKMMQWKNI